MGTPKFMSPEQAMGQIDELDERSDIYSLGGILYTILTLRPPVDGKDLHEILAKVKTGGITPPTAFGATTGNSARHMKGEVLEARKIKPLPHIPGGRVPAALSAVAMKALTLDKARRYQDVAALSADIEKFQTGFATTAEEAGLFKQVRLLVQRHKREFAVGFAAWLIITALAVWFVLNLRAKEQRAMQAEAVAVQKESETSKALARSALSLAEAALREGNGFAMQAALNDVPEDLRDSTWRYLLGQSDSSFARIVVGAEIDGVVAHPRLPSVFAVVDHRGRITVLNVRSGERLLVFTAGIKPEPALGAFRIAISPDGERIAVGQWCGGDHAGGLAIHDARTGQVLLKWEAADTKALAFSPDGRHLVQADLSSLAGESSRGLLKLWDAGTGELRWTYAENPHWVGAAFTSDGLQIVAQAYDGPPHLVNIRDGSRIRPPGKFKATASAVRPDGGLLVAGAEDGTVRGLEMDGDRIAFGFRTDGQSIEHILFTATGTRFITIALLSDGRQAIRLWDAGTGAPVQTLLGGRGKLNDAAVHPLSGELLVASPETRAWSLGGARWVFQTKEKSGMSFWGGENLVLAPDRNLSFVLYDLSSHTPTDLWKRPISGNKNALTAVSADGRVAAVGGQWDKSILLLGRDGQRVEVIRPMTARFLMGSVCLSPTGKRLAVGTPKWADLEAIDTATGEELGQLEHTHQQDRFPRFSDFGWLTDDELLGLVTANAPRGKAGAEERIVVWDVTTGKIVRSATNPGAMDVLAIAPDGRRFAEAGADKMVRIRDAATLAVLKEFRVHDAPVTALAWHPKKPILATGSSDLTIRLWNLDTGERMDELRGPLAAPHSLAFAPGGQRLACASQDSATRIWDPPSLRDETVAPLTADDGAIDEHVWFKEALSYRPAPLKVSSDGWADVLSALTPAYVERSGNGWSLKEGELFSPEAQWATLPLPGKVSGTSYRVRVKLRQLAANQVFHVVLPVADRMCGFDLEGRNQGIYTGLVLVNGKYGKDLPGAVQDKQVKDSEPHDLEVTVRLDGANATITATLDGQPLYEWTGPTAALSQLPKWASTEPGFLALGSYYGGWAVSEVKLKRLDGGSLDFSSGLLPPPPPAAQPSGDQSSGPLSDEGTMAALKDAALLVWFGKDQEHRAASQRMLELATNTDSPGTANRIAKLASLLPIDDEAIRKAVLDVARKAVDIDKDDKRRLPWAHLSLGMAEYRGGHYPEAATALGAAIQTASETWDNGGPARIEGTANFYLAMCLFREGKADEARALFTATEAKMKPLPADEQNPLANGDNHDDLILWLACKEAKALLAAPEAEKK